MSKAAKQSIFILIFCLIMSLAFAGYVYFVELQTALKENEKLQAQLQKSKANEKKQAQEAVKLNEQIKKLEGEKSSLTSEKMLLSKKADDLEAQVKSIQSSSNKLKEETEKYKKRVDIIKKERDELMVKLKERPEKIVYKEREPEPKPVEEKKPEPKPDPKPDSKKPEPKKPDPKPMTVIKEVPMPQNSGNDEYWASVLRDKAALEIKLEEINDKLAEDQIEILDLKQENSDLELELDVIKREKEEVEREIAHKKEMIDHISLELARAKNDNKMIALRTKELNQENTELRQEMKTLVLAKSAMEKSIVRVTQEKNALQKELGRSESIIQSKIDEIWEIKDSLDETIKEAKYDSSSPNEVELPPIVVSADGPAVSFDTGAEKPGFDGEVVSINGENNFIIINLGKSSGIQLGDIMGVYRDDKYIARIEVIQVRKDISAADIKDQWSRIKTGDQVR